MRYIWIISYIYQIPSAILYPQKVLRPSPLPRIPEGLTSLPPPIPEDLTSLPPPDPRRSYLFPPPNLG